MPATPRTSYPTSLNLYSFLESRGVCVPETLDTQAAISAAAAEWELRTGWGPYLAARDGGGNPVTSTRLFDPPGPPAGGRTASYRGGRMLSLETGLLSLTSLAVGVIPDPSGQYEGAGTAGTLLTNNLNFYLRPQNAPAKGLAFTEVEFLAPLRGVPQSIAVTGAWGRVAELTDDTWRRILERAAALCAPELGITLSGGAYRVDDVYFAGTGAAAPLLAQMAVWDARFDKAVRLSKRITV